MQIEITKPPEPEPWSWQGRTQESDINQLDVGLLGSDQGKQLDTWKWNGS
ncbi:hypothetical protein L195_g045946 [Trifolium pratense]|uniref:Uncharacterized protein n=1 Tax=Trifolium pratense TaxID=57577 RepID=A0A2K3MGE1_TRIPR|nr:hypothetical protein L195_g045946 [Trifolium pratense]